MWLQVKSLSDMLSVSWMKQEILYIKNFLAELVHKTWDELPAPKPKRSGPRREKKVSERE